jgi:hypothetical protein
MKLLGGKKVPVIGDRNCWHSLARGLIHQFRDIACAV